MKKSILILQVLLIMVSFSLTAEGQQDNSTTIIFGDVSWDSVQVHNRIMGFIIENGLTGYKADYIPGDTMPIINGIIQGDVDVDMESWHSNVPEIYKEGIESGDMIDLGKNLPDAPQGWWIPRYLVEGPDAPAPDLKTVADLPKYAHLFKDPEDPSKGLIYGGVAGWGQLTVSEDFFKEYNLEETFNLGIAGSGTALAGTMVGAYKKKEAWCGYYWAPTAVLGKLDMIRLAGSEYPAADVNILVSKSMLEKAPDVVEILKKYSTTVDDNNEFLAKMEDEGWDTMQTAQWFLKNKEEVWTKWVSSEVAEKVKAAL
ncbi:MULTISPECIES: ABC transporter substrate-binding protein [unclassified Oceanispirochaeta]|uniref:ABC transporter substrate-binding protein n=1 Tax=unclassified Oceanispirochaeta TaxID=2635722 RepID=UPI000E08E264|nr:MULTISPECIES: ABC transporter substrate-binding protein [unclassified Oceanispirochaeta]MBF9014656.1 ABC transporter substrate-binding protein [Oceanispirochaeta sp. M2]NPD70912.1 ABC transporter substrate-binding protein [Oceanispirochaeta sp. M1]RDG33748.1 ABC transporter substrate-binding protein [Oceanispirochaeta sp. M1]